MTDPPLKNLSSRINCKALMRALESVVINDDDTNPLEKDSSQTRSAKFPWEAGVAIVSLVNYFYLGDSHLAYAGPYLLWESSTVIVIRFALLSASIVFSLSAIRRGFSPSLFLTVPCFIGSSLLLLNWLNYLIRWIY